jgi:Fuc2NAc and GlcNAc transferase
LLSGQAGISIAFLALAAAGLGFLAWNWPPAKIFMGDVGSGFLGFALASLGLFASQRSGVPLAVWMILNGIFLVDATVTLLRRMLRGERWLEPHRLHAYQHLSRRWKSHLRVTVSVVAINIIWLLPWAWFAATHPNAGIQSVLAAIGPIFLLAFIGRAGAKED